MQNKRQKRNIESIHTKILKPTLLEIIHKCHLLTEKQIVVKGTPEMT